MAQFFVTPTVLFLTLVTYRIVINFREFRGFVAICESFLHKIWGVASFGMAKASNPRKFSPRKSYFHQFAKVFSLTSFPLYGMLFHTPHKMHRMYMCTFT